MGRLLLIMEINVTARAADAAGAKYGPLPELSLSCWMLNQTTTAQIPTLQQGFHKKNQDDQVWQAGLNAQIRIWSLVSNQNIFLGLRDAC